MSMELTRVFGSGHSFMDPDQSQTLKEVTNLEPDPSKLESKNISFDIFNFLQEKYLIKLKFNSIGQ